MFCVLFALERIRSARKTLFGHLETSAHVENNVKIDDKETECEDVDWVSLTNAVRSPGYLIKCGIYEAPYCRLFAVTSCHFLSRWFKYSLLRLLNVPGDISSVQDSGVKFHTHINTSYVLILKSCKFKVPVLNLSSITPRRRMREWLYRSTYS